LVGGSSPPSPSANNRLVRSSSPPSPTTQSRATRDFPVLREWPRTGGDSCAHFVFTFCRVDLRGRFGALVSASQNSVSRQRRPMLRPLASQLGRKVKTQTSLPGFDSPHDAVQENGTYGRHGKAVGCVSPTALLFLSNAFVDIGAGPRRRQERSQNGPNEQFIGMTHQVTAGLLGLISVGVFVTPMPKKCRGKTTRSHLRVANRQRSSASLPPNASN
jgi:hypothetical protein